MTKNYDHTGQPAVTTNTQTIVRFLQDHVPFGQMEQTHQLYLADHCELRSFKAGDILFSPESGQVKRWYLLFDGEVKGIRQSASADHPDERFSLTPGDAFPVAALLGERPTRTQYTAATACQCLVLQIEPFERLLHASEPFRLFAFQGISPLLASLQQQAQAQAARIPGDDQSLDTPLQQLLTRTPVSCTPDTTLEAAVKLMHGHQVSSVAITDESGKLEGIFTLRDLRRVFADASVKRSDRISGLMTKTLHVLEARHSAYDAAMLMTRHHIGHVCIVENGHLAGVLSERDLFALQRVDLVRLSRAIRYADSVNSLQQLRSEMPRLVNSMLAHGAQAMQITALITQLNDHTTTRIIELMLASHGNPDIEFCWLAFGSEGRHEQTLLSDQDNGILFFSNSPTETEAFRQTLLPIAHDINQALDQCGLTLCPGNIMASNPELCLSFGEWQHKFAHIIQLPDPNNLLAASIFFDIRNLWGNESALPRLMPYLLSLISDHPQFQRMMAENALQYRLPLSGVFDRIGHALGISDNTINLKTEALSPFVDATRILALAYGISQASTLLRLEQLEHKGAISREDAHAFQGAYKYLQLLRMQEHLQQSQNQQPLSNTLDPASLNPLERKILHESIRQAHRLQELLRFKYQL